MYPPTNYKQETIKNMIKKRYNHLLEICEQTKQEISYLDQNTDSLDFQKSAEIEKTRNLINSIEKDVQMKQFEFYASEVKNRHQQLMSLYHRTQDEIMILENTLGHERAMLPRGNDYARLGETNEPSLATGMAGYPTPPSPIGSNEGLASARVQPTGAHEPLTSHLNLADRLAFEEERSAMAGREELIAQATHNLRMKEANQHMPNRTRLNLTAQPSELTNEEMHLEQMLAERFSSDR